MAKDPAFLFYTDNFQSGTQFFSDEQVGIYIRILCAQHLHGHLLEKQVKMICKTFDEDIMKKFIKDADGKYYNQRLEVEILKRKNFSLSRSENRKGKFKHIKKKSKRYVKDMGNENENENENEKSIISNFSKFKDNLLTPSKWGEEVCMKAGIRLEQLPQALDNFISHCIAGKTNHETETEFASHFRNLCLKIKSKIAEPQKHVVKKFINEATNNY